MAKVTMYNLQGKEVGEVALDDRLFGVEIKESLVHEVATRLLSNKRSTIAHTKDRGEVAGTGQKPWRQKGTGRARHGSRRSPLWVGGGITFGPTSDRTYGGKINKRTCRKVLAMVLTDKVKNGELVAVETLDLSEAKTKTLNTFLKVLPGKDKKTLLVLVESNMFALRAAQNLPGVSTIPANSINPIDLMNHRRVLVSQAAIDVIQKVYLVNDKGNKKKS